MFGRKKKLPPLPSFTSQLSYMRNPEGSDWSRTDDFAPAVVNPVVGPVTEAAAPVVAAYTQVQAVPVEAGQVTSPIPLPVPGPDRRPVVADTGPTTVEPERRSDAVASPDRWALPAPGMSAADYGQAGGSRRIWWVIAVVVVLVAVLVVLLTRGGDTPAATGVVATAAGGPAVSDSVELSAAAVAGGPFADAYMVAAGYWAAWCPWDYTLPAAVRSSAARQFLTAGAAADLQIDSTWWTDTVVAGQSVATCSPATVSAADGPDDGVSRYVTISGSRTVTAAGQDPITDVLSEQRVIALQADGRWLVDRRVEGD